MSNEPPAHASPALRSLAIGIPLRNRRHLVEYNAFSLSRLVHPPGLAVMLIVLDDCSEEFGTELLQRLYPPATRIIRRDTPSGGADHATAELLALLVAEGTDVVMILDSDLILRGDMLTIIAESLPRTDGFLSLFNTDTHPAYGEEGAFLLKRTVGAAGTVWQRSLAEEVLARVPVARFWDWRFCEYLQSRNVRLYCLRNSAVQHLGFATGQNSGIGYGDFGKGFADGSLAHLYFITEEIVRAQTKALSEGQAWLAKLERMLSGDKDAGG